MIQQTLARTIREAAVAAASEIGVDPAAVPEPELSRPSLKQHGDWATNLALVLASRAGKQPRQVAEAIVRHLDASGSIRKVDVAGPGFINLFLDPGWLHDVLREILERGPAYGRGEPKGQRVQVEYVSANPTGPLHVGTARNAALGDSLANILGAAGYDVEREYYWNDTGTQIELFGASVEARYLARFGIDAEPPEGGYHGSYVDDLAAQIETEFADRLVSEDPAKRLQTITEIARHRMLDSILSTLERFGVRFDTFRLERELVESGEVDDAMRRLRDAGFAYEADG